MGVVLGSGVLLTVLVAVLVVDASGEDDVEAVEVILGDVVLLEENDFDAEGVVLGTGVCDGGLEGEGLGVVEIAGVLLLEAVRLAVRDAVGVFVVLAAGVIDGALL